MSDRVKAIFTNGALWSAVIAAVVGTILYVNPSFPREILALYVGLFVAILAALGVTGITSVEVKAAEIKAERIGGEALRAISAGRAIPAEPGEIAFEAFSTSVGRVDWGGNPIPPWRELSAATRAGWAACAAAARKE